MGIHTIEISKSQKLRGVDLSGACLDRANLNNTDLRGANLTGTSLIKADLADADLRHANITEADLRDADLRWSVLIGANFTGADLGGALLNGADLSGANLTETMGLPRAPIVSDLDIRVALAVRDGAKIDMKKWHNSCGTIHCRAGWAIALAGWEGIELEKRLGSSVAGALIYAQNTPDGYVPDFYASNGSALDDIQSRARKAFQGCTDQSS